MVKKWVVFFVISLLFVQLIYAEDIVNVEIIQVEHNIPEIEVYFNVVDENNEVFDYSLHSDDVSLKLEDTVLSDGTLATVNNEDIATHCLFLVDISTSITSEQIVSIRGFIKQWIEDKGLNDQVGIVTFGDKINVIQEFTQSNNDLMESVSYLERTDNTTAFFDGLNQGMQMIHQQEAILKGRKIMIVFSDAEDVDAGGVTYDEIIVQLDTSNIPIYGVGTTINPNAKYQGYLDDFAYIARKSGGKYYQQSEQSIEAVYANLQARLAAQYIYNVNLVSNYIDYNDKALTLIVNNGEIIIQDSTGFNNSRNVPDLVAPTVLESHYDTIDGFIEIIFSEPISKVDQHNFIISNEKGEVLQAKVVEKVSPSVVHMQLESMSTGMLSVKMIDITDINMEKNPLLDKLMTVKTQSTLEGTESVEEVDVDSAGELVGTDKEFSVGAILILIGGCLLLLILRLIVLHTRKKGLIIVIDYHNQSSGKSGKFKCNLLESGVLVGRSSECNLVLDDSELSRQHFSIFYNEGNIFVEDLKSSNKTYLNSVELVGTSVLKDGDRIKAGQIEMKVVVII